MDAQDRRTFIRRSLAFGGLVAVADLPALARTKYERINAAYVRITAGATKPFSLLHISDTHLTEAYSHESDKKQQLKKIRTDTFGGEQRQALADTLAWAKEHVDYVVHTGDLIDFQSQANFDAVRELLGKSITGCVGNHEWYPNEWLDGPFTENEDWKNRTRKDVESAFGPGVSFSSKVINGVNLVFVDDSFSTVTPDQVARFKAEVARGLPIILLMHVPIRSSEVSSAGADYWGGSRLLGDIKDPVSLGFVDYLKGERLLKGILAGHLHITVQERFSPTATQYVVGGNFDRIGEKVVVS